MLRNILLLNFLPLIFGITSCLRLDGNLFNPEEKIESYQLDNFKGEREISDLPAEYQVNQNLVSIFTLESNDNGNKAKIYAIYIGDQSRIGLDTVFLYCHGNKNHMDLYWNRAKLLANVGGKHRYGVLLMDYRGYGLSEGNPTESGLYADVKACLQWLKEKGMNQERLIMYGFSMGTAPATKLTAENEILKPSKLILEAPFASAETMIQDAAKLSLPGSYFVNLSINNAEEIKKVTVPFCWFHGEKDDFLSRKVHGQSVFDNYSGSQKSDFIVSEANHNDLPSKMGFENYTKALERFLAEKSR
jgi:alpha/beta superfamily hydrolase